MPMMFGFGDHRRQLLRAELDRFVEEAPPWGARNVWLVGDFARGHCSAHTTLELVIEQFIDEPFHRRPDFWVSHFRPQVGMRFLVYTPDEVVALRQSDAYLIEALALGELVIG